MTLIILFITFLILLALQVPVAVSLILATLVAILLFTDFTTGMIVLKMFGAAEAFPLIAIPLFVMAGAIMSKGGMADRLISLARSIVGNMRGGIAITSILACMFFAAISGSGVATTAAIGTVMIPAIMSSGFSRGSATSLQATAGSIGIIIPPSIPLILMGYVGDISISSLFMAGIIPGTLIGMGLMLVSYTTARYQNHPVGEEPFSFRQLNRSFWRASLALLAVLFVLGGIMGGYVTATEAGIIAVIYSLAISLFVYRDMSIRDLGPIMVNTAKITGIVVLVIGAATPFAWLLTVEQTPEIIAGTMLGLTESRVLITLFMLMIMIAIGTFLDLTPAMFILVPIFMPVAVGQLGMDPVHFGVMVVAALGIGQSTPPVGVTLFVACSVGKIQMHEVVRPMLPFLAAMITVLLAIAYIPALTLWLPEILPGFFERLGMLFQGSG